MFDLSSIPDPTPAQLSAEGAKFTQDKSAGPYPGYRTLSEETKQKISQSLKGITPWNKGKKTGPLPESTRKKMSASHTIYKTPEEKLQAERERWQRSNRKRSAARKARREAAD